MNPTDLAYLAGLIDGEGCLTLDNRAHPVILIGNTDERMIRWLQDNVDRGSVSVRKGMALRLPNRKPQWSWRCTSRSAATLLQMVLPYLVCKREQAEILISVMDTVVPRSEIGRGRRLSSDVVSFRNAAIAKIRQLNHRGTAPIAQMGSV